LTSDGASAFLQPKVAASTQVKARLEILTRKDVRLVFIWLIAIRSFKARLLLLSQSVSVVFEEQSNSKGGQYESALLRGGKLWMEADQS
jgi:hypothetical protein